ALLARCKANGYVRVRIDGQVCSLDQSIEIDARRKHSIEVVIDRLIIREKDRSRIADSVEHALSVGNGVILVTQPEDAGAKVSSRRFSQHFACDNCGRSFEELTPHHFSFNSRLGWCPTCEGLGIQRGTSTTSIAVRPDRSILDGAVAGWDAAKTEPLVRSL